jgi:hypothetical protein
LEVNSFGVIIGRMMNQWQVVKKKNESSDGWRGVKKGKDDIGQLS